MIPVLVNWNGKGGPFVTTEVGEYEVCGDMVRLIIPFSLFPFKKWHALTFNNPLWKITHGGKLIIAQTTTAGKRPAQRLIEIRARIQGG